ncbi:MAG TPA: hypothetical protein VHY34_06345 [Caulobacteraceae bacterium]|jgi:hypothetical protein|nr:hypothetical protein [Caulobacteraceae bacterium]
MASDAGRSNALGWAVLAFLAGVAATLGLLVLTEHHPRHHEETTVAPTAIPPAKVAETKVPKPVAPKPVAVSSAVATETAVDQQVQEDAAAAGMTSRRQTPVQAPD